MVKEMYAIKLENLLSAVGESTN